MQRAQRLFSTELFIRSAAAILPGRRHPFGRPSASSGCVVAPSSPRRTFRYACVASLVFALPGSRLAALLLRYESAWLAIRRTTFLQYKCKEPSAYSALSSLSGRRLPILPGRHHPSTFGVCRLNCCVRDGNRWNPAAITTNLVCR